MCFPLDGIDLWPLVFAALGFYGGCWSKSKFEGLSSPAQKWGRLNNAQIAGRRSLATHAPRSGFRSSRVSRKGGVDICFSLILARHVILIRARRVTQLSGFGRFHGGGYWLLAGYVPANLWNDEWLAENRCDIRKKMGKVERSTHILIFLWKYEFIENIKICVNFKKGKYKNIAILCKKNTDYWRRFSNSADSSSSSLIFRREKGDSPDWRSCISQSSEMKNRCESGSMAISTFGMTFLKKRHRVTGNFWINTS